LDDNIDVIFDASGVNGSRSEEDGTTRSVFLARDTSVGKTQIRSEFNPSECVDSKGSTLLKDLKKEITNHNIVEVPKGSNIAHNDREDSDENFCYGARINNGLWERCKDVKRGNNIRIIIDSGATTHMFPDGYMFMKGKRIPPTYPWVTIVSC
jgi:hypothetical protein